MGRDRWSSGSSRSFTLCFVRRPGDVQGELCCVLDAATLLMKRGGPCCGAR